jgi:uridine nucleosidase
MLHDLLTFFTQTYAAVFQITAGPPLHDPLAVAVLLGSNVDPARRIKFDDAGGERWSIEVVREGEMLGRTVVKKVEHGGPGVRIPRGVDIEGFWGTVMECVERAVEVVEKGGGVREWEMWEG